MHTLRDNDGRVWVKESRISGVCSEKVMSFNDICED